MYQILAVLFNMKILFLFCRELVRGTIDVCSSSNGCNGSSAVVRYTVENMVYSSMLATEIRRTKKISRKLEEHGEGKDY